MQLVPCRYLFHRRSRRLYGMCSGHLSNFRWGISVRRLRGRQVFEHIWVNIIVGMHHVPCGIFSWGGSSTLRAVRCGLLSAKVLLKQFHRTITSRCLYLILLFHSYSVYYSHINH